MSHAPNPPPHAFFTPADTASRPAAGSKSKIRASAGLLRVNSSRKDLMKDLDLSFSKQPSAKAGVPAMPLDENDDVDHLESDAVAKLWATIDNSAKPFKNDPAAANNPAEDDERDIMDLPERLVNRPGSVAAVADLERCSIAIAHARNAADIDPALPSMRDSRIQGDVDFKGSFLGFPRWGKRFVSVLNHAYFGVVMMLFKYNSIGTVSMSNKIMVSLDMAKVHIGPNSKRKGGRYCCEFRIVTDVGKKYTFSAEDSIARDHWVREMRKFIAMSEE